MARTKAVTPAIALRLLDENVHSMALAVKALKQSFAPLVELAEGFSTNGHGAIRQRERKTRQPGWMAWVGLVDKAAFVRREVPNTNPDATIARAFKRGWVKRVKPGVYALTPKGKREVTEAAKAHEAANAS